jgi:hypothetical protein
VIEALIANRLTSPAPLVRVSEWAEQWAVEEVFGIDSASLNDDRIGRALDAIAPELDSIVGSVGAQAISADLRGRTSAEKIAQSPRRVSGGMTQIERIISAPAQQIFEVLADGWSYASWVVGASHIRDVDPTWPAVGTRLHHNSGPWPLHIQDITVVRSVEQDRKLELEARLWVFGRVRITLTLIPLSERSTWVVMEETAIGGPAKVLPHPLQSLLLKPRNAEALARLADMASGQGATLR